MTTTTTKQQKKQPQQTTFKINIAHQFKSYMHCGLYMYRQHYSSKVTALFAIDRFLIGVYRFSFICTIPFYSEREM